MKYWPLFKELILATSAILLLLFAMYSSTGNSPPVVVVESDSMMNDPDGEIGAIDAGDLILVHAPESRKIITYAEAMERSIGSKIYESHGLPGDVIVYDKNGEDRTPIIHRAIIYARANFTETPDRVNSTCENGTFDSFQIDKNDSIKGTCVITWDVAGTEVRNSTKISWDFTEYKCDLTDNGAHAQYLRIIDWSPKHEGYLTLGDNNNCNVDQGGAATNFTTGGGLSDGSGNRVEAVTSEWVEGIAGAEIPWFGSVKLMTLGATTDSSPGTSYVPSKTWFSLTATVFVLLISPVFLEGLVNKFLQRSPEMISYSNESMKNINEKLEESE
ncbi:MAG: hypothetical protein CMB56_004170 [Methanobacteriota archaeon]|nr:MAG: hypothetical protein CMB56_004170 [Euryarchaeota archaeon]